MRIDIRWKWMLTHFLVGSTVLLFMLIYLSSTLKKYFHQRFEERWLRELRLVKEYVSEYDFRTLDIEQADKIADRLRAILGLRVTLIRYDGKVLGDSHVPTNQIEFIENHGDRPEVVSALRYGFGKSQRHSSTVNMDLFYLAEPVGKLDHPDGVIRIALPMSEIHNNLLQIEKLILWATGFGFFMIFLMGFIVSRYTAKTINQIVQVAKKFARGDFSDKIRIRSRDEIGDLAQSLNEMADHLESYLKQIKFDRDQLEAILNSMIEGVVVINRSGEILLANRTFLNMFKLKRNVLKKSVLEAVRSEELLEAIQHALDDKEEFIREIHLGGPEEKYLEAHVSLMGGAENPSGCVVVLHDITKLKHLETVRRDFVANVSHELQTPLTAIKGYAETLLENSHIDAQKSREFLQTILKHANRMTRLVSDLLILSRLESTEDQQFEEIIDLKATIPRVVERFDIFKSKDHLQIEMEIPDSLPPIKGVSTEIETALENLIDNAIKYGADGGIVKITVKQIENEIEISVSDQGVGIPVEDQPRIFERFYRVDKGRSRALGGTGLGLSIVKHIVQRHGGRIWLESQLGHGSTFHFTLPLENSD